MLVHHYNMPPDSAWLQEAGSSIAFSERFLEYGGWHLLEKMVNHHK